MNKTCHIYFILKSLIIAILICLEMKSTVSTSLPHSSNFNAEKISADKRKDSKLDLSNQELTDQDMPVVVQYALENNKVSAQKLTRNLILNFFL